MREIAANELWQMLEFEDVNDPESAHYFDPTDQSSQSAQSVTKFVSASITMTRDPVTRGIDGHFPWLRKDSVFHEAIHIDDPDAPDPVP